MYFKYKVGYIDYMDNETEDVGLVYADSYGRAAEDVVEAYGGNDVYDIYIKPVTLPEDGNVYIFSDFKLDFKEELGNP